MVENPVGWTQFLTKSPVPLWEMGGNDERGAA
jgi:hypothetical protein